MNKYLPHIYILPEDRAYEEIANGFSTAVTGRVQVEKPKGGWTYVRDSFAEDYIDSMAKYPNRYVIMLVDSDYKSDRHDAVKKNVTPHIADRVFVLSVWSDADKLNADLGSIGYEEIGRLLAEECENGTRDLWSHKWLNHNAIELARMGNIIKPLLF